MYKAPQKTLPESSNWTSQLGAVWDYLGPFPIHAREQHLLSPSYPLDLSHPVDYTKTWPSSYADNGIVSWQQATINTEEKVQISFPHIRWSNLRATEGWAAVQHHVILRTTLQLLPSGENGFDLGLPAYPQILVKLDEGSYFSLVPKVLPPNFVPKWFAGNIYDLERALPASLEISDLALPGHSLEYDLYVSGDYEIRLFGDPLNTSTDIPTLSFSLSVEVQDRGLPIIHHEAQDIMCDFVDGFSFGNVIGVGIQSIQGSWTVQDVSISAPITPHFTVSLRSQGFKVAHLQTRVVPITLKQTAPFSGSQLILKLEVMSDEGQTQTLPIILSVNHLNSQYDGKQVITGSFLFASSSPSLFLAVPPLSKSEPAQPPILAIHGAGVDVIDDHKNLWMDAMPQNCRSWIIAPTGRTSWGLDWHGPSVLDALSAIVELATIIRNSPSDVPPSWKFPHDTKVLVIGHSNGGQGSWHLAARYPDKVIAVIPAAAYFKSQAYVALTMGRSQHFIDPTLRAILETSFTPDDNDLHMSNLVDTPILAIHGGADENVPVWHTRELYSTLKSWNSSANITYKEDPGEGHWYDYIFKNPTVQTFLDGALELWEQPKQSESFTLTVANPRECGSLHGWKIHHLAIPGRLGRLNVKKTSNSTFTVDSTNVHTFSIRTQGRPLDLIINGQAISAHSDADNSSPIQISKELDSWKVASKSSTVQSPPGRMQSILTSPGPISIIVANDSLEANISVAQRLAHMLHVHHRLDCDIIGEHAAIDRTIYGKWTAGNVIFIGPTTSIFASDILSAHKTPVRLLEGVIQVAGQIFDKKDQAILFTHPHPSNVAPESFALFLIYNSESGLERAVRLLPYRTGVAVPDWVVTGKKMDAFGAGGIEAAGVWGLNWVFSEPMSWSSL